MPEGLKINWIGGVCVCIYSFVLSLPWFIIMGGWPYTIGLVPWENYIRIMQWDDSAAAEAFNNAKMRYWGYCNGFPCSIPLPNPDAYIDEIDWISIGSNAPELEKIENKKDTNKFKRKKYDGLGVNKVDNNRKNYDGFGGNKVDNKRKIYDDGLWYNSSRHRTSRFHHDHDEKDRWWRRNIGGRNVRAYDGRYEK